MRFLKRTYVLRMLLFFYIVIYTAAMANLGGGDKDSIARSCRKPEVMSDAAYIILSKNSNSYTGNFAIDEDVLRDAGVTDLGKYSCVPGRYHRFREIIFILSELDRILFCCIL